MTSKHEQEFKMIGLNIAYFRKLKGISQMKLRHLWILRTHLISRHTYCYPFTQILRLIHLLFN